MNIIKEADFKARLQSGLSGGYFFFGEEDYLKGHYIASARKAVSGEDAFGAFNDIKINAESYSAEKLADVFTVPPMMSEKKFILLDDLDIDGMKEDEFEDFLSVLGLLSEYDYNVFIFSAASGAFDEGYLPKAPSPKLIKLASALTAVQFDLMPRGKLSAWVKRHFAHEKVSADDAVCDYLIDYCGRSMYVLKNEAEKLSAYVKSRDGDTLTPEDVNAAATESPEFGAFAFSNAIMQKDVRTALSLLSMYKMQKKDPVIVMGEITKVFSDMLSVKMLCDAGMTYLDVAAALKAQRMNDYKAKLYAKSTAKVPMEKLQRIIALCSETDMQLKNSNIGYVALERLICRV